MVPESANLVKIVLARSVRPPGLWDVEVGINSSLVSESVRHEVEQELARLGYETKREMRQPNGRRLRGLWFRKISS